MECKSMSKYSRTSKYEDLRKRLQSDDASELNTNDLAHFEKRLNEINPHNFDAPQQNRPDVDHDPIHARRKEYLEEPYQKEVVEQPRIDIVPPHDQASIENNENFVTTAFNNEYLNEYIDEVKRYNIDQGNAFSTNTDVNILRSLRGDVPTPPVNRPYPMEENIDETCDLPNFASVAPAPASKKDVVANVVEEMKVEKPIHHTVDIPSFSSSRSDDLFNDFLGIDDQPSQPTSSVNDSMDSRTRDDIAKEVQSLINAQDGMDDPFLDSLTTSSLTALNASDHAQEDRNAREQLLNETTKMRAQLDDYEDNLTEVNDQMSRQSKVMNVILIVLIIALVAVLCVVLYWVLSLKEII